LPATDSAASARPSGDPGARDVFCVDDSREFLRDLPLVVAEPPAEVAEILAGWGVRTIGQLTALSKADVTQRLGPEGLTLWERAAGEVTRPLRIIALPQTFTAEMTLEYEIETLEPLLFVLRRFIDRLALELRNAGFVAGEMTLGLLLADETAHTRAFRLPEPTAQEEILFRVLHTHLESLHTAATVRGVNLECRPVRPLARQQGLFESALRDPHGFAETLGRVAAVVGAEHVGTPQLENTHRPDAVQLVTPASVVPPMAKPEVHPSRGLPLRRYREPLTATVELNGPSPAFVWTRAMQGAVRALAGPWRGSGDWWDASRWWRREEWDVELESGGVYRLLRKPEGWFVEGEYD
jgi:protein ImuB